MSLMQFGSDGSQCDNPRLFSATFLVFCGPEPAAMPAAPQQKWGPALLPAPTAPSEGSAGIRNLVDRSFRPTYPLSILAHQLRRRFASCYSLLRGARLIYSTTWPEGSLVFRLARPGIFEISDPKTFNLSAPKPPDVPRPFLG